MILPGHLAAGYLAATHTHSNQRAALLAAIFPDLVDKMARYVLRASPSGRVPAHSLFVAAATLLAVRLTVRRPDVRRGWLAGYAAHLASDVVSDLLNGSVRFSYLLWPLLPPPPSRYRTLLSSILEYTAGAWLLEGIILLLALRHLTRTRDLRSSAGACMMPAVD